MVVPCQNILHLNQFSKSGQTISLIFAFKKIGSGEYSIETSSTIPVSQTQLSSFSRQNGGRDVMTRYLMQFRKSEKLLGVLWTCRRGRVKIHRKSGERILPNWCCLLSLVLGPGKFAKPSEKRRRMLRTTANITRYRRAVPSLITIYTAHDTKVESPQHTSRSAGWLSVFFFFASGREMKEPGARIICFPVTRISQTDGR